MQEYKPRRIAFIRVLSHGEWQLKLYGITCDATPPDDPGFRDGIAMAFDALPAVAVTEGRAGAGFVIAHKGAGINYVVLGWWDRQNELPLRVFVREAGAEWRPAQGSESVCVWDLQVIAFERDAYVKHVMRGAESDMAAYLDAQLEVP